MKTSISIIIFLIISSVISGQQKEEDIYDVYEECIKTKSFTVLDINFNKKVLAFKLIYELQPDIYYFQSGEKSVTNPVDCKYAGMEKYPRAGVILGIYDLKSGDYSKTFSIYKSCVKKEDCYKHNYSEKQLEAAKILFKDYDLDITKKPKALWFSKKGSTNTLNINDIHFSSYIDTEDEKGGKVLELFADEKLLFSESIYGTEYPADDARVTVAFKSEDKIVFLCKSIYSSEWTENCENFFFSSVYTIKDNEIIIDE